MASALFGRGVAKSVHLGGLAAALLLIAAGDAGQHAFEIVHEGFDAFSRGEFDHSGANLYVSRKGRVQFINRWDLNSDGFHDFVFSNTHNVMVGSIDALGYLQTERGFRSVISPVHDSLALYDRWLQAEKNLATTVRLPSERPTAVLFHDVDRDGDADLLFASAGSGDADDYPSFLYWGTAAGYRRDLRLELPTVAASDVAAGDLDGDGYEEIVFANAGSPNPNFGTGSYVYWGSADRHGPHRRTVLPTASAVGCAIGDLDRDEFPELLIGDSGEMLLYRGAPTGPDWKVPERIAVAGLRSVRMFHSRDLGAVVLAVTEAQVLLFTIRSGRLAETKRIARGGVRTVLADLDGDNRSDIVLAGGEQSAILWGSSAWSLSTATSLPTLDAKDVAVADLDRDGYQDIVFANHSEGSYGDLDVSSYVYWGKPLGYAVENRTELQTFGASAVAIGDLNRDGRPDVVFGNSGSGISGGKGEHVYVYWGRPHRGYSPAAMSRYPCVMGMASALADLDDDGNPELLVANSGRHYSGKAGASYVYWGSRSGPSLERRTDIEANEVGSWAVGDLNRDGYLDAAACDFDALILAYGGPEGIFTPRSIRRIEKVATAAQVCRLIDFDGDGWLDIFAGDIMGKRSRVLLGSRQGYSLDRSRWIEAESVSNAEFADLDGDGRLDMILLRAYARTGRFVDRNDSWIRIYRGVPGGFSGKYDTELPASGAFDVAVADLDGDGDLDVGVSQYASRDRRNLPVHVYWNDGAGRLSVRHRTSLPAEGPSGLLAADFDEDGHTDLLVVNHKTTYKEDNHSVESFVYWGSERGFSMRERTYLPGHGPHFLQNVDVGNLATRRPEESYVSPPIEAPGGGRTLTLSHAAETPHGSKVRFQVRSSANQAGLRQAPWLDLETGGKFHCERWLQYRAVLIAGRGHSSPALTKVVVRSSEKDGDTAGSDAESIH